MTRILAIIAAAAALVLTGCGTTTDPAPEPTTLQVEPLGDDGAAEVVAYWLPISGAKVWCFRWRAGKDITALCDFDHPMSYTSPPVRKPH